MRLKATEQHRGSMQWRPQSGVQSETRETNALGQVRSAAEEHLEDHGQKPKFTEMAIPLTHSMWPRPSRPCGAPWPLFRRVAVAFLLVAEAHGDHSEPAEYDEHDHGDHEDHAEHEEDEQNIRVARA